MSFDQQLRFLAAMLTIEAVMLAAALALAIFLMIEARWWRAQAVKRDPALALLDDAEPPLVGRWLRRWREDAP
jgi:hypothetical protein